MSVEGIFRRNGNIRRLKDLTEAIDHDPSSVDLTQDNPVQLAALLKKFFRELPEPLMTFKLHRLLIASQCVFLLHGPGDLTYQHLVKHFPQIRSAGVVFTSFHSCFPRATAIRWKYSLYS